jgi:hypothetical protein
MKTGQHTKVWAVSDRKQQERSTFMNQRAPSESNARAGLVVAQASASTWVVAFSRHLIPGACFKTRKAAVGYASMLASAAGLGLSKVKVFD